MSSCLLGWLKIYLSRGVGHLLQVCTTTSDLGSQMGGGLDNLSCSFKSKKRTCLDGSKMTLLARVGVGVVGGFRHPEDGWDIRLCHF